MDDPARAADNGAAAVVHALVDRGATLAVVESLTGGLLAATIVDIAGVSSVFRGGLVAYATELKSSLVGVPAKLLDERGPVDPDVAVALAEGAGSVARRTGASPPPGSPGPSRRTASRSASSTWRRPDPPAPTYADSTSTATGCGSGSPR
ncbi:hypothetical protein GCM10027615_33760 [Plantactinospora veratri]